MFSIIFGLAIKSRHTIFVLYDFTDVWTNQADKQPNKINRTRSISLKAETQEIVRAQHITEKNQPQQKKTPIIIILT